MKRYIYLLLLLFCSSCGDVLDVVPENSVTFTNYFQTEQDLVAIVNSIHHSLRGNELALAEREMIGWIIDDVNTEEVYYARDWGAPYYLNDETSVVWSGFYQGIIYNSNLLLDNAYRVENIKPERLELYLQQAYFAKGFAYFRVAQNWGDAPIVQNSTDTRPLAKSPVGKVLDEALKYALKAFDLPKFEDLKDENGAAITFKQYASKGAATALLAHIYAWRAALENNIKYWEEAEKYCSLIIDGKVGSYSLASNPEEVCTKVLARNSQESIWELQVDRIDDPLFLYTPYAICQYLGYPIVPGAVPTDYHYVELTKETVRQLYGKNDLRINAYFFGMDSTFVEAENKIFINKWRYPIYEESEWSDYPLLKGIDVNRIVWRLADIMLLRAECRVRLGRADAVEDLNSIRARAGVSAYDPAEGDLRYMIFRERERELIYEGTRFYDVVRNGYWKTELPEAFSRLTEDDIKNGALYFPVGSNAFFLNDLMLQNTYWLTQQK